MGFSELGIAIDPFGSLNLTESSPAQSFTEPLTLAEVKAYLRLPDLSPADQGEDDLLSSFIIAAREAAEMGQGRDLVVKQWDLSFDYWPGYRIPLKAPLVSVDLVQYKNQDGTLVTLAEHTDYETDTRKQPGSIVPPYSKIWPFYTPWPTSSLLIRFTAGMTSSASFWREGAGTRVKIGMRLLISQWYENRIPFVPGAPIQEYPWAVFSCLSAGSVVTIR